MAKPEENIMLASKKVPESAPAILLISDDKFNDLELFYPYYRLQEAGFNVALASPAGEEIKGDHGFALPSCLRVADAKLNDYVALYLPGGKAPASLRKDENVLKLVKAFAASGKPIFAICHGAQILAAADLVRGKRIAAWPDVKEEIEEAGGTFVNAPLVEDGQFITARWPGDIPGHLEAVLKALQTNTARKAA